MTLLRTLGLSTSLAVLLLAGRAVSAQQPQRACPPVAPRSLQMLNRTLSDTALTGNEKLDLNRVRRRAVRALRDSRDSVSCSRLAEQMTAYSGSEYRLSYFALDDVLVVVIGTRDRTSGAERKPKSVIFFNSRFEFLLAYGS
jgi:hypothetical protein